MLALLVFATGTIVGYQLFQGASIGQQPTESGTKSEVSEEPVSEEPVSEEPVNGETPTATTFIEPVSPQIAEEKLASIERKFVKRVDISTLRKKREATGEPLRFRDLMSLYGTEDPHEQFALFGLLKAHNSKLRNASTNRQLFNSSLSSVVPAQLHTFIFSSLKSLGLQRQPAALLSKDLQPLKSLATVNKESVQPVIDLQTPKLVQDDNGETRRFDIVGVVNSPHETREVRIEMHQVLTPQNPKFSTHQSLAIYKVKVAEDSPIHLETHTKPGTDEITHWTATIPKGTRGEELLIEAHCMNRGAEVPPAVKATSLYLEAEFIDSSSQEKFWTTLAYVGLTEVVSGAQSVGKGKNLDTAIKQSLKSMITKNIRSLKEQDICLPKDPISSEGAIKFLWCRRNEPLGTINYRTIDIEDSEPGVRATVLATKINGYPLLASLGAID